MRLSGHVILKVSRGITINLRVQYTNFEIQEFQGSSIQTLLKYAFLSFKGVHSSLTFQGNPQSWVQNARSQRLKSWRKWTII